jgi:hypothetical protein
MGDSRTRTIGVISKVDQVISNWHSLHAIKELFSGQGLVILDIPWAVLIS